MALSLDLGDLRKEASLTGAILSAMDTPWKADTPSDTVMRIIRVIQLCDSTPLDVPLGRLSKLVLEASGKLY
jgi:hypothetical protein